VVKVLPQASRFSGTKRKDNAILKNVQTDLARKLAEQALLEQSFYSNKYYYGIVVALERVNQSTPRNKTPADEEASAGGANFGDLTPIDGGDLNHYSARIHVPRASSVPSPRAVIELEKDPKNRDMHDAHMYPIARGQVPGTLSPGDVVKVRLVPDTDEFFIIAAFESTGLTPCDLLSENFDGTEPHIDAERAESRDDTERKQVPAPATCDEHVKVGDDEGTAAKVWDFRSPIKDTTWANNKSRCFYSSRGKGVTHYGIDLGTTMGEEVFACGYGEIRTVRPYHVYQSAVKAVYEYLRSRTDLNPDGFMPAFSTLLASEGSDPARGAITNKVFSDFIKKRLYLESEHEQIRRKVSTYRAGTFLEIKHIGAPAKLVSRYIHVAPLAGLSAGDIVKAGDLIGHVTKTGIINGRPHVHFELVTDNDTVWAPYGVRPGPKQSGYRKFAVNPGALIPGLEAWIHNCPEMTPHGGVTWTNCN